jgi:plastocyanin
MTFRIDLSLTRVAVSAACLGAAWGCSSRTPEPDTGAAPVASAPASSDSAHPAPARASTDSGRPDSARSDSAPSNSAAGAAPAASAADSQYLKYDAATKTVTFELIAGPFTFNGFGSGGGTLTVPPGTTNVWNFVQDDGTPHSAEVASGSGPIPNAGGDPAIPRAYTKKVVEGMVQGDKDVMRFTAPDTGAYRIICGVPGHALSGMWIWFKVDPKATAPTFGATPK